MDSGVPVHTDSERGYKVSDDMGIWDYLIIAVIVTVIVMTFVMIRRDRKKGRTGCDGCCTACTMNCPSRDKNTQIDNK